MRKGKRYLIGQITAAMEKAQGKRTDKLRTQNGRSCKVEALKSAGLSKQEASRCERIASIPEEEFEEVQ
jgi:hypothetical protein